MLVWFVREPGWEIGNVSGRTNFGVRAVAVGPAVLSVCAPGLVGFADGGAIGFPAHSLLCWLWARWERVDMVQAAQVTGFVSELRQCSRSYWKPEAIRIYKA